MTGGCVCVIEIALTAESKPPLEHLNNEGRTALIFQGGNRGQSMPDKRKRRLSFPPSRKERTNRLIEQHYVAELKRSHIVPEVVDQAAKVFDVILRANK